MIPKRLLGSTGVEVSCLGLGGEGALRTYGHDREARAVIEHALELGINYLESARAYAGSEGYYGLTLGAKRERIFLASKAHERTAAGATAMLEESLRQLRTDWLDLWQLHDLRTEGDLQQIFAPKGAVEAFERARREGKVRFIGITGHQDPAILLKAMSMYDFDTVLLPVNPAEAAWLSFPADVLPEAKLLGMGIIGMKVLCRGLGLQVPGREDPAQWLRYALAHEVSTVVIGCDNPRQVLDNADAAGMPPLSRSECAEFEKAVAPLARQLLYYK